MTNAERGRATGQHDQCEQQAHLEIIEATAPGFRGCSEAVAEMLPLPTRIELGQNILARRADSVDTIMALICATFSHPERIQITRFQHLVAWQEAAALAEARAYGEAVKCEECGTVTTREAAREATTRHGGTIRVCMDCWAEHHAARERAEYLRERSEER